MTFYGVDVSVIILDITIYETTFASALLASYSIGTNSSA